MKVLLIYPPFGAIESPYISIPTLAAYLCSRGIEVHALDANLIFFQKILSPDNIKNCMGYAENRLHTLNNMPYLSFSENVEYLRLVNVLKNAPDFTDSFYDNLSNKSMKELYKEVNLIKFAISLASMPYFPEGVVFMEEHKVLSYNSRYKKFSTKDIIMSMDCEGILGDILESSITEFLESEKFDIVGISATFPDQVHAAFKCASIVKKAAPEIHVTMGGAYVSCHLRNLNDTVLFKCVDSFVLDEGELPLERLVEELSGPSPDLGKVPGLIYLSGSVIRKNSVVPPIALESLPVPAYDIFPLDEYLLPRNNMPIPFRLSRGCYWAKCAFCRTELSLIHHYDQSRADYLCDQIEALIKQTGSRIFLFTDDSSSPEILEALSRELIERQINISWTTNLRFDPKLTIERCMLYRQAGCYMVYMGLEAYNDRILRLMKKGTTIKLVDRVLSNMSWAGLRISVYMIVGFPTETEAEAVETAEDIKRLLEEGLISRYMYHTFNITPYSDVYNNPQSYGISKIHPPEGQDLDAPVFGFEGTGMSRGRAMQLEGTFNAVMVKRDLAKRGNAQKLIVADYTLKNGHKLKHDITKILESIDSVIKATGDSNSNSTSFFDFLDKGNELYPR